MSEFLPTKNNFQEDESLSLSDILRDSYFLRISYVSLQKLNFIKRWIQR